MNYDRPWLVAAAAGILIALSNGCTGVPAPERNPVLRAEWSESPVILNGLADDAVWSRCESYPLCPPDDSQSDPAGFQPGNVKLAYDDQYLYLFAELADDDIAQYESENHTALCEFGDVIELFICPGNGKHYWEFHGAPNGAYTAFFFPGPGRRILPAAVCSEMQIPLGVSLRGTMNSWQDTDRGWSIEMAIPMAELRKYGDEPNDNWRILAARYNYSKSLNVREFSATSRLPVSDFHCHQWYGRLQFGKGPETETQQPR